MKKPKTRPSQLPLNSINAQFLLFCLVFFFVRVTKNCFLTSFCSPTWWQVWGQEQKIPGVQEADAAAGKSAPDRSVCVQLSGSQTPGLTEARVLFEGAYFSNWIEEDFYVLQPCLRFTGMITIRSYLLFSVPFYNCLYHTPVIFALRSTRGVLPADFNSGATEFGSNCVFLLM